MGMGNLFSNELHDNCSVLSTGTRYLCLSSSVPFTVNSSKENIRLPNICLRMWPKYCVHLSVIYSQD